MANIKISQLPNINGNLTATALLPIVSTNGTFITDKITLTNLANYILGQSGNLFVSSNISNLSYNVINAAQPNITSVGTLTGLTVVGTSNLGYPNNVVILGGTAGQVLATFGNGSLGWVNQLGATGATGPRGDSYSTTSTSNLTIGLGNKSLVVDANLAYTVGQDITVAYDFNNYMAGPIITYNSANGNLQFQSITVAGAGTYDDWTVNLDGSAGGAGATGATGPVAGSNTQVIFNDAGTAAGSANFTFDSSNNLLTLTGNLVVENNISLSGNSAILIDGNIGTTGQVITSNGTNTYWASQFYYGDLPPDFATLNYGDIFFYVDTINSFQRLYMWVTDGSSDYFYDFLPPEFGI